MADVFATGVAVLFWLAMAAAVVLVGVALWVEVTRLMRSLREDRDEHAADFEAWARELEEHTS